MFISTKNGKRAAAGANGFSGVSRLKSEAGLASNHWFDPNRGPVSLQTIGLAQIGGQFRSKPLVWPKSGVGFASNHWLDPNQGSVSLQTIGWTQIGGRFHSKPLVWLKSGAGLASNHWFGSNRGPVPLQTMR